MMTLRKRVLGFSVVIGLSALLSVPTMAHAQRQRGGAGNGPVPMAFKAVNPTPDEQTKFDALQTKYNEERRALTTGTTDPKERTAKQRELQTKFQSDVEALLTPDQQKQFKEEVVVAPVLGALRPLNLTPDEITKIRPIAKDTMSQVEAARQDKSLKGPARAEKTQSLVTDMKAKVRPLLTPEQQTQFDTLNINLNGGGGGGRRRGAAEPAGGATAPVAPK